METLNGVHQVDNAVRHFSDSQHNAADGNDLIKHLTGQMEVIINSGLIQQF